MHFVMKRMAIYTLLLLGIYSCKKNNSDQAGPTPPEHGAVRGKGAPAGEAVHVKIGPAGGRLTTTDGRIQLEVPAGAVTRETDFSIQPISNTLPGSPGKGYRLLPEGQTFAQPVKLTFHYDDADLVNTSAQALYVAFQGNDGIWKMIPQTTLSETAKTLTVNTTHFSDWAIFAEFYLEVGSRELKPKGTTSIDIMSPFLLAPLTPGAPMEIGNNYYAEDNAKNIRNWQVFNEGTLQVAANKKQSTYTAPNAIPSHNPVEVSVEIYNIVPPGVNRPSATGKVILLTRIYIVDETYFIAEINGVSQSLTSIFYLEDEQGIIINGNIGATTSSIMLFLSGHNTGYYPYNMDQVANTGVAVYNVRPGEGYVPTYSPCYEDDVLSPGGITIEKKEKSGDVEYVTGRFAATVYREEGQCPGLKIIQKSISGRFRVMRKSE